MTDQEAIKMCQGGNRDAFRHIVETYQHVLYGTAWLMTRDAAIAGDMVQEAFLSAWQGIRGFHNGRPLKPWLVRILVNRVLSDRRRPAAATIPLNEATGGIPTNPGFIRETDDKDQISRALDQLPEDHRQVVILKYFSDLSIAEVAAVAGCPEGTVKSRLNRALEHLRQVLEGN